MIMKRMFFSSRNNFYYVNISQPRIICQYLTYFFNVFETLMIRPSRNRTYINDLEGHCPSPLDDRPVDLIING